MQRLPSQGPCSSWPSPSAMIGFTPGSGRVADPGLVGVAPGNGEIRMPPVSVWHPGSTLADDAVVPQPRFRVDRLADAAEDAQGAARGLLHRAFAVAHQRADRGR